MSFHARPGPETAPVRRVAELPGIERRLIRCLRLRATGEIGRARLRRKLDEAAPAATAAAIAARLDELMALLAAHGRRPLRLNLPGAADALGDECVLARLVALACEGSREEAVLMSTLIVRPEVAPAFARAALGLGGLLPRLDAYATAPGR